MIFSEIKKNFFSITIKNIGIVFIASAIAGIINFFYQIVMGRLLGPSEYGVLNVIFSALLLFTAIMRTVQTASAKYASSYYAKDELSKVRLFFLALTKRILIITFIIFVFIFIFINRINIFLKIESIFPILLLAIMIIEGSLFSIGIGTLQGLKKFKSLGVISIIAVILKFGLGILFVYFGFKANGALAGLAIANLVAYLLILIPLKGILFIKKSNPVCKIDIKKFYRNILFILIAIILFSLLSYIDTILVKHFFSPFEAGYYSATSQIGRIIFYITGALIIVIFPRFSEKFTKNESLKSAVLKSYIFISIISVVFLLICYFFPEFIIRVLYGEQYLIAANLIFRYGLFMTIVSFINLQVFYFISIDMFYYLIGIFLGVTAEVLFIWFYHTSLENVLLILILSSFIVFVINNILMILKYKNKVSNI